MIFLFCLVGLTLFLVACTTSTTGAAVSAPECKDRLDNDGDGKKDYPSDAGCSSRNDNDESNCGDGRCEGNETSLNCTADCGVPTTTSTTTIPPTTTTTVPPTTTTTTQPVNATTTTIPPTTTTTTQPTNTTTTTTTQPANTTNS